MYHNYTSNPEIGGQSFGASEFVAEGSYNELPSVSKFTTCFALPEISVEEVDARLQGHIPKHPVLR